MPTRPTSLIWYGLVLLALAIAFVGTGLLGGTIRNAGAQESVAELQQKIQDSQRQLEAIEREIKEFERQLNQVGAEKQTLQKAINELDLSRKKIQSEIRATEQRINSTDLEIEELRREIRIKELEIKRNIDALAESLRRIDELENESLIETVLGRDNMNEVWDALEEQTLLQQSFRDDVRALKALKKEYESARDRSLDKLGMLQDLNDELSGQKDSLDTTRATKDKLLDQTKSEEANYQKILAEKKAARQKFEQEMAAYEAQLKFILDPTTIPPAGSGVLRWPLDPSFMSACAGRQSVFGNAHCVTQYFGDTAFARSGAYNGKGHNGIDFGASAGTKVTAALGGSVTATGNTDEVPGCYSYGKWVLLKHGNGLSKLYGHLSSISVSPGQAVQTGELIGYSGNTGYSTGPHLHFTVYATQGVKVQRLSDIPGRPITGCSPATIPVAGFEAYLNPMSYL